MRILVDGHRALPLLALLALGATIGCSKAEPEAKKAEAWTCARAAVPSGEVVQCTTGAMVAYGDGDYTSGSETLPDDPSTTYDCPAGSTSPECPPSDPPIGDSTSTGTTGTEGSAPPSDGTGSNGSDNGSSETTSSSSGGGATGEPPPSDPPATDNSGSSTSGPSGNNECGYSEDLPYCGGESGSSSSSSSSGSSGSDCGKPNCAPPGQDKKGESSSSGGNGASSGGASSSGGSSSGTTGTPPPSGKGKQWKCKKTPGGKKCQSVPECGPGTHPAPCGACVSDDAASDDDCVPPSAGGCWVTGGGFIQAASTTPAAAADGNDNFGGNAKAMKKGGINGHWNHVDHGTKSHALGRPEYLFCRHVDEPGPGQPGGKKGLTSNQVYFGGHARFRTNAEWADGYWFDVVAKDHGEPGSQPKASKNGGMVDTYHFTLRKIVDPANLQSGTVVYETAGGLVGGNIQIHPANNGHPASQTPLPSWVSLEP